MSDVSCPFILHGDPLQHVLDYLDVRSLCTALQVCKEWSTAGSRDDHWRKLAAQKWPAHTLRLLPFYASYKDLLKDDNKRSACPTIDLISSSKHSAYKYNRASYFLECRLTTLQWDRGAHLVRLCFDARGDLDLRQPDTSSAAVVVDRPEHNYHLGGMMQPKLCDLVQTARAEACELWINRRRHTKGCLVWTDQGLFNSPLRAGSMQCTSKCNSRCTSDCNSIYVPWPVNTSLVFCFANAVVSGPQYLDADCNCVELLKIPAHCHYRDAFVAQCTSYELPNAPDLVFRSESEDKSKLLWQSLPDVIRNNQQWWG